MSCPRCGSDAPGERGSCSLCSPPPEATPSGTATLTLLDPGASAVTSPALSWTPPPSIALGPGSGFGDRYTIVEEVGAGGMGRVYKAIDRLLSTTVALKLMSAGATHAEARQRFQRELAVARAITHLNVCRVHDLGEVEGTTYISMEYVEGQTLEDLIRSVGVLSTKQTLSLGRQICAALAAIHEAGVVHRDLKPSNIMLDRAGRAIVMDFGMAYQRGDDRLTGAGAVVGTLAYLSPEQARGEEAQPRSDVYAVGLILYEMLTGRRPPGDGAPLPLALRDKGERCPPPSQFAPEVPPELDTLVLRCLQRDPQHRFANALALDEGLALLQSGLSVTGILPRRPAPWPRKRRAAVIGSALALIAVAAGLWLALRPPALAPARSVAVLPLEYTGPPEQTYLRNVVPLLVSERLRSVAGVQVAPFGSSRTFAPGDDMAEVARQLGVDAVLRGTVAVSGSRIELDARVARPGSARAPAPLTVTGTTDQLVALAERLAGAAARDMGGAVKDAGVSNRRSEALEHYFNGRSLLEGWDVPASVARADEEFAKALALEPAFAEALALRAQTGARQFMRTRDDYRLLADAEEWSRRALELGPTLPEAHTAAGLLHLARGRSVEAAGAFERGLQLAPADDSLCRRIARAYWELGRQGEAERMYRRAVELRPTFWNNHSALGIFLLRQGRLREAKPVFRQVLELRPESDTGFVNLAAAHILAGEHREAEPLLLAALRINPTWETHNNLGAVYYALGRYDGAAREWKAAIDAGGRDAILFSNLGDALRQLARAATASGAADQAAAHSARAAEAYDQAIARGRDALAARPEDAEERAGLAMALAGRGRCPAAREEAARATRGAASPAAAYYAAIAHALCGARDAAVRDTRRAIEGGVVSDVRTNPDLRPLLGDPALRQLLPR